MPCWRREEQTRLATVFDNRCAHCLKENSSLFKREQLQDPLNVLPDHFAWPLNLELLLSKMSFLFLLPFSKTHKYNIL